MNQSHKSSENARLEQTQESPHFKPVNESKETQSEQGEYESPNTTQKSYSVEELKEMEKELDDYGFPSIPSKPWPPIKGSKEWDEMFFEPDFNDLDYSVFSDLDEEEEQYKLEMDIMKSDFDPSFEFGHPDRVCSRWM